MVLQERVFRNIRINLGKRIHEGLHLIALFKCVHRCADPQVGVGHHTPVDIISE